jgi:uncharacterized tellurite resistance protein B-like protein
MGDDPRAMPREAAEDQTMSERLAVCQALAAMIRQHGEPNEEEVTFVGMAAMQLGLDQKENEQVQRTLREGGDFAAALKQVESKSMRAFFLRRMLAATLLDDQINEAEQAFIDQTAQAFGLEARQVADLIAWIKVSIEVERKLTELLGEVQAA